MRDALSSDKGRTFSMLAKSLGLMKLFVMSNCQFSLVSPFACVKNGYL